MIKKILFTTLFSVFFIFNAYSDTTDQKWMKKVELKKTGDHCVDDKNCFNRYHPNIPPVAKANPGDFIVIHTRDALDTGFRLDFYT
jgi:formamidase